MLVTGWVIVNSGKALNKENFTVYRNKQKALNRCTFLNELSVWNVLSKVQRYEIHMVKFQVSEAT